MDGKKKEDGWNEGRWMEGRKNMDEKEDKGKDRQ